MLSTARDIDSPCLSLRLYVRLSRLYVAMLILCLNECTLRPIFDDLLGSSFYFLEPRPI